ncbi:MAG: MATE family efflux transporter [Flavobacteriales bacterium]|nr:MATE family efflux transporter [Flavobacteriales bacterium]
MKIQSHTDELGSLSIGKLLTRLSVPATIGMMVMVLYNVVDTIFVAKYVGSLAIGGLAIVMPITMLISAVGMALGVGGSSLISRYLGSGESKKANVVFGNLLMLTFSFTVLFTVIGYIFPDTILKLFGGDGEILPYAREYYLIVLAGSPFLGLSMAGNNIIRSEGNARMSMVVMIISSILNLILDYVLIIWMNQGIAGAAWATLISQVLTFIFIAYYFIASGKSSVKLRIPYLKLDIDRVKEVLSIGSSSFARQGSSSLVAILVNHSLMSYGSEMDVAAYGILNRVMLMSVFPMIGLVQGFLPIVGYNYGAKKFERVISTIKISFVTAFAIGVASLLLMSIFPREVFEIFTNDELLIVPGSRYLVIVMIVIPLVGIQMLGASFFQAIGRAKPALFLTLARQIIFLLPLIFILPQFLGIDGIWISFPISDMLSTLLTLKLMHPEYKKITKL